MKIPQIIFLWYSKNSVEMEIQNRGFKLFHYFSRCLHSGLGRRSPVQAINWRVNMAMRKTTAKSKTETQVNDKSEGVTLEQALKEEGEGRTAETIKDSGKKTGGSVKTEDAMKSVEKPEEGVTLQQALKEEGEGRTPESIKSERKKPTGMSKVEQAMKIMEEMWDDIQSGKVKRKDVIKRFMEEIPLSKAGSSTYYSNCKQKIMKDA